jgi:hypothetical protein
MNWRHWTLLGGLLAAVAIVFSLPSIPQSEAYHNFADQRALLGIPYCLDVLSNLPFLFVGVWGILSVLRSTNSDAGASGDSVERAAYLIFFAGVALTSFGSSYYHLQPGDARLVWDRLPMTIAFLSLVAATFAERVSARLAAWLLGPLLAFGVWSVFHWRATQAAGHGDLRPYILVQFGSLLVLLLLLALFPARYTRGADLLVSLGFYVLAKILEVSDGRIFALGHIVSGHTLKHLAAALSAYWVLRMLRLRRPAYARA